MAFLNRAALEKNLSTAFHGGERVTRELRLTKAEAEHLRAVWPKVSVSPMPSGTGERAWYEVRVCVPGP